MLFGPTQVWYDELNYLEERKICEICSETMSNENQRMLPCQHTFCLEPCLRIVTNFQTKKVKCPFKQCNKSHNIPDLGISEFPKNLILFKFPVGKLALSQDSRISNNKIML